MVSAYFNLSQKHKHAPIGDVCAGWKHTQDVFRNVGGKLLPFPPEPPLCDWWVFVVFFFLLPVSPRLFAPIVDDFVEYPNKKIGFVPFFCLYHLKYQN